MISYEEKRKQFSEEAQKRITKRAQEIKNQLHILKRIREITGMSQDALAKRLEVDQSYISRLERRDNITLATLTNIVRTLGGSIEITFYPISHYTIPSHYFSLIFRVISICF